VENFNKKYGIKENISLKLDTEVKIPSNIIVTRPFLVILVVSCKQPESN